MDQESVPSGKKTKSWLSHLKSPFVVADCARQSMDCKSSSKSFKSKETFPRRREKHMIAVSLSSNQLNLKEEEEKKKEANCLLMRAFDAMCIGSGADIKNS